LALEYVHLNCQVVASLKPRTCSFSKEKVTEKEEENIYCYMSKRVGNSVGSTSSGKTFVLFVALLMYH